MLVIVGRNRGKEEEGGGGGGGWLKRGERMRER